MTVACRSLCCCSILSILVACGSEPKATTAPAPVAAAPAAPSQQAPSPEATPAAPAFEDDTFRLAAVSAGPYTVGGLGHFSITLTSKGEYHVNEEYPMTIDVVAPSGVKLSKASFEKGDAAEFSSTVARFDVPVTPSQAGEHAITAKVSFAVCTPETCVPDERTLALALRVE